MYKADKGDDRVRAPRERTRAPQEGEGVVGWRAEGARKVNAGNIDDWGDGEEWRFFTGAAESGGNGTGAVISAFWGVLWNDLTNQLTQIRKCNDIPFVDIS